MRGGVRRLVEVSFYRRRQIGIAQRPSDFADGRGDTSGLVRVTVGLERAAEALAGQISAAPGTKIHIDPTG